MSKNKNKILILIILLVVVVFLILNITGQSKVGNLVGSNFQQAVQKLPEVPAPNPSTPAYNPPKEIKYDSNTNLEQELETINPKVLDDDFKGLELLLKSF